MVFRSLFLLVCFFCTTVALQAQSDCRDFLVVCGNTALSLNSNGTGTNDFANPNNQSPDCGFSETQSLWLKVPISRDGLLSFTIRPKNNQDDFDFAIYGPNVSCDNLGASIRCSSTNPQSAGVSADTGLRSTEPESSDGPGASGNGFVSVLPVLEGEEYIILIDNFSQTNAGFDLIWGSSAPLADVPRIEVADLELCDPDGDGLVAYDLNDLSEVIEDGQEDVEVSYHRTENDALLDENRVNARSYSTVSSSETLFARVTADGSGCSSIGEFRVIVNPDPVLDEVTGSQSICPAVSTVPYTATGTRVDIYEWFIEGGILTSGQGTADVIVNWGGSNDNAMVKLVGKSLAGCISDTLFLPVKINLELEPVLPQGDVEICFLDRLSATYVVPATPGSQYNWEVENGQLIGANGGNQITVEWNDGATLGKVSYREFNPSITDCEGFSDKLNIVLLNEIVVEVITKNPSCNGETNGSIMLGLTGISGTAVVNWSGGEEGLTRNDLGQGDYAYTITDDTGCQVQGMISLTEPEELTITLVEPIMASCSENKDGGVITIIAGGTGAYRYEVNGENGMVAGNNLEVLNLGRGDYNLTVRDQNDCEATLSFTVRAPELLEPDLESLQVLQACPGQADGTASIDAIGGTPDYSFLWQPVNQEGAEATDLAKGDYTVFIKDANGCETSLTVAVGELIPRVDIPNAFSPNGDGANDTFSPITNCQLDDYRLQIFNRWGNVVFFTDDQDLSWSGSVNNTPAPDGKYSYKVSYRVTVNDQLIEDTFRGTLRIIR